MDPTRMNSLERALVEKIGCDHGWEYVVASRPAEIVLGSARHRTRLRVVPAPGDRGWRLELPAGLIRRELARFAPAAMVADGVFTARDEDQLARLLRRSAELATSLPNQAAATFQRAAARELAGINATETKRLVRQRVGQEVFRQALMEYWGGGCAVTGINVPELLRASHAKPWAACETDEERLNVYNGLLLVANLDALFDRGLITFAPDGVLCCAPALPAGVQHELGLDRRLALRWLAPEHEPFLAWHRCNVYQGR